MKKIIIMLFLAILFNFAYSSATPEGAVEEFFNPEYTLEDDEKAIGDFLAALNKINKYTVISTKVYKEKEIEYAVVKVEVVSPKEEEVSIKLISEMFKKMGDLYLSPEYRPYIKGFMDDSEEDMNPKMLNEIFSSFTNAITNSKFSTEKNTFELYVAKDSEGWNITDFETNVLYDKKIEKYIKNNKAFYKRYDASILIDALFDDFL